MKKKTHVHRTREGDGGNKAGSAPPRGRSPRSAVRQSRRRDARATPAVRRWKQSNGRHWRPPGAETVTLQLWRGRRPSAWHRHRTMGPNIFIGRGGSEALSMTKRTRPFSPSERVPDPPALAGLLLQDRATDPTRRAFRAPSRAPPRSVVRRRDLME